MVDDNIEIHSTFNKILADRENDVLDEDEAILFGHTQVLENTDRNNYSIDSAYQGQDALKLVQNSLLSGEPYALAFIDIIMPPGWNGIETIKHIWKVDPNIQMVICSAYSDYSWKDITSELGNSDNFLILKKPFEAIEISQLAMALTKKWGLVTHLNTLVKERTNELEYLNSLTKTTLDSMQEGILAVGLNEKIILFNEFFLKQWNVPEELLQSEKSSIIFQRLSEQVEDSVMFIRMMSDLRAEPKFQNTKQWRLNSGNILELSAHPHYLHDELIGTIYCFRDISEQKELEEQLLHLATHDNLTGLPNRALLNDRINQAIAHAKRDNSNVAVIVLDLDFFKETNDTFGHPIGDKLLKIQAKKLAGFIRDEDTVARIGGDEFVVVLALADQFDEQNIVKILNQFLDLFSIPCQIENNEIIATASLGVSIYPQDGHDSEILLKNADAALYHAKEQGRNRFQFYMEEFNQQMKHRVELTVALNNALKKNELSLDYQPLVDLELGTIIGMEALLRWNHPLKGLIPPVTFIPIAEETGLILPIGEWVLRNACAQAKIWQESSAYSKLKMSINISVKQFRQKNFVLLVKNILKETQFDPHCLELEITESLILRNITEVISKMVELKKLGIRFAIDDFGTGYSSLGYIKNFPFDTVKIDKLFIDNIATDPTNASIVQAIISMTKTMGIDVLAEGVEHIEQVTFLKKNHGDQVQSYYFCKPLNTIACTKLLQSNGSNFQLINE